MSDNLPQIAYYVKVIIPVVGRVDRTKRGRGWGVAHAADPLNEFGWITPIAGDLPLLCMGLFSIFWLGADPLAGSTTFYSAAPCPISKLVRPH
jgi:hypothetical protein